MSLFKYAVSLSGGLRKEGRITAKDESSARKRISELHSVVEWHSINELPPPPAKTSNVTTKRIPAKPVTSKAKSMSKLECMLFLQHGKCFFCGEPLLIADASIEHLNPKSRGGSSSEDNEVVCHKALNQVFGDLDLKRKFAYTLRNAGQFKCP